MNQRYKNIVLLIISFVIVYSIVYLERHKPTHLSTDAKDIVITPQTPENLDSPSIKKVTEDRKDILAIKAKKYQKAKELVDIQGFINSDAFKLSDIAGKKVILIDFWTYSCINCQRTLPYLKAWNEKYKDKGLVIVGVHTPEFDFEKDYNNVLSATKSLGVTYPVVLDSNRGTWTAYDNQYWPHEYLIDIDGYIVHDKIGEGDYDVTERAIQDALKERNEVLGLTDTINTKISNPSDVIDMNNFLLGSPETYFGASRNEYLGNGEIEKMGSQIMTIPETIKSNTLYLGGTWNFTQEFSETAGMKSSIVYKYKAKNVYFVASSKDGIKATVLIDGKIIDPSMAGKDVDKDGTVTIKENRLYDLVKGVDYKEHTLQLQIEGSGLDAYTFTFG